MSSIYTLSSGAYKQELQALCALTVWSVFLNRVLNAKWLHRANPRTKNFRAPTLVVVNDTCTCDSNKTLTGLLKTELGLEGCASLSWSL